MSADKQVDTAATQQTQTTDTGTQQQQTQTTTTATTDTAVTNQTQATQPTWPDNWRDLMAGDDQAYRKQLERVSSPLDVAKNYRELEKMKAEFKAPVKLPENATPEDIANYRKAIGVPETPDKYELNLPAGFTFGEADKPFVDHFLKTMHDKNAPPEHVNAALGAYAAIVEQQATQYVERDRADKTAFEDAMRAEWGNDYRANINIVSNFIQGAPESVAAMIMNGRNAEGRALLNDPEFVRWMNNLAREINPAATVVTATGGGTLDAIEKELQELDDFRKKNISNGLWHKDEKRRERHRQLLDAKSRMEAKGKG